MPPPTPLNKVIIEVGGVGHPDMLFDVAKPYAACLICGMVYQTAEDRLLTPSDKKHAFRKQVRDNWRLYHAGGHTSWQHRELEGAKAAGFDATPEAVQRLASYGIYVMQDLVGSDEHAAAGREAPRAPQTDAEGT